MSAKSLFANITTVLGKIFSALRNFYVRLKRTVKSFFHIEIRRSISGNLVNIAMLVALSFVMLVPMLYIINNAFKPMNELFIFPPKIFVQKPTFDNFIGLKNLMNSSWVPMSRYVYNSVIITVFGTLFHVIFSSMAAYVLEKHKFPGAKLMFSIVILSLMFSGEITKIPNYVVMSRLGLIDSHLSLILPAIGAPLGLFLMKQFMSTIPDAVLEAAKIDGGSELRIFSSIVMPSIKPAWLTLIIFSFNSLWNARGDMFLRKEALKPLPYALNQIMSAGVGRSGVGSAVALILMIVPIVMFILSQSSIVDTMATSGMKD